MRTQNTQMNSKMYLHRLTQIHDKLRFHRLAQINNMDKKIIGHIIINNEICAYLCEYEFK